MSEFDPDAYLAKKTAFNPDAYLQGKGVDTGPTTGRAMELAAGQGITGGFLDELGGLAAKGLIGGERAKLGAAAAPSAAAAAMGDPFEKLKADARAEAAQPTAYELMRDKIRTESKAAEKSHPKLYTATETAASLPFMAVLPESGAIQGGLNALGHAEGTAGEQALQTAGGALAGHVIQSGGRWLADKFSGLAGRFGSKAEKAAADALVLENKAKDVAQREATGAMGQKAADVLQSRRVAKEAAEDLAATDPEFAVKLREAISDPGALARLKAAAENYLPRMKQGLEDFAAKEADLAKAKAIDPIAIAAEKMATPFKTAVLPRAKYMADKAIPLATTWLGSKIGDTVDGENSSLGKYLGAGAGFLGGVMLGKGGTQIANMMKTPTMRGLVARGGQGIADFARRISEGAINPTVAEATDDPEKFKAFVEWLKSHGR